MRNKRYILMTLTIVILFSFNLFTGCGKQSGTNQGNNQANTSAQSITASGSTALQPLVEKAAAAYRDTSPNATINVQGGGSGTGLTQVAQGAVEIGNSDKYANEQTGIDASQLVDHRVCVAGFVLVTNMSVKITNLTKAQIIDIFTGKITNWNQVGGNDMKIVVINRPESSGTRFTFKKYILGGKSEVEGTALTEDSSGAVSSAIKTTNGSIGYLALSYITEDVKKDLNVIKIDGVEATNDNIISGKYPFWAYEHMYTKGQPTGLTKSFIDYMTGPRVSTLIEGLRYIPINEMKVQR